MAQTKVTMVTLYLLEPENLAQTNLKISRLAIETGFVQHASGGHRKWR